MGTNRNYQYKPRYVSKNYVLQSWGISPETFDNAMKNFAFETFKPEGTNVIFVRPEDIDAWIEKGSRL